MLFVLELEVEREQVTRFTLAICLANSSLVMFL